MKVNLMLHGMNYPKLLKVTRSNTSGQCSIPYIMNDYTPLTSYLDTLVPPEWNEKLQQLLQEERAIIEKRQQLMASYRLQFQSIAEQTVPQFRQDFPEYFL